MSENNRLQNVIEMQKVTISELQKDFENVAKNSYSHTSPINIQYSVRKQIKSKTYLCLILK